MAKTILITGASSGIGKETAFYFAKKGWNVAATMRKPQNEKELKETDHLKLFELDVLNTGSIQKAIEATITAFGKIDVLLNNAGYGMAGVMEYASKESIQHQFDVNVFGLFEVTKQILPHFRQQKSGRIINISSMGGRVSFPLFTYYHATKYAVEGFSESLNYELNPLGIDVKLIEPGGVQTDFAGRSMNFVEGNLTDYNQIQNKLHNALQGDEAAFPSKPTDVAKVIFEAATTSSKKMRYLVGKDAKMMVRMKKILGTNNFQRLVKRHYKL
ncbi:SDR family oxidoreductase [Marivirga sp. S37H4]|uniref:SDR family oxidoreductase n=1 Tax=Marivirga aurantiaca TaxID=2802615 RepID=A0A934WVR4_9BACT|nr:SDR family oxidoreductase [Marivirga aurantiaca]MBK6263827.1 SDR family oxidoreductase [Marivirga aurantiaca]